MSIIISRQKAITKGLTQYFTGKPCKHGHISPRHTQRRGCVACASMHGIAWRLENKERTAFHNRRNRKKRIACTLVWYHKNKKKQTERLRAWQKANPGKCCAYSQKRRAQLAKAGGFFTHEQIVALFKKQNGKCALCPTTITLISHQPNTAHRDHKRPLSKGGSNSIRNIQLTCSPCNLRKGAKLNFRSAA